MKQTSNKEVQCLNQRDFPQDKKDRCPKVRFNVKQLFLIESKQKLIQIIETPKYSTHKFCEIIATQTRKCVNNNSRTKQQ